MLNLRLTSIIILLISLIAACSGSGKSSSGSTQEKGLLWEISGNGIQKPSYLLGTFHIICKDDLNLGPQVSKAVEQSSEVYFELDMDDPSASLALMTSMKMKEGKTLKDICTLEQYERMEKFLKDSLSLSLSSFKQFKPFFLASLIYPKLLPCTKRTGVEEEVMKMARQYKKEMKGLESFAFQASIFDSIPYDMQLKEILNMMDSFPMYRSNMKKMVVAYKSQDLDAIKKMTDLTDMGGDYARGLLLDNRNMNWAGQLDTIMRQRNVMVAVGAGHLPGEEGLISLFRKKGFKVKPIRY